MATISLLYHAGDAESWSRYFYNLLHDHGDEINVGLLDLTENSPELQNTLETSTVLAVLLSPCMLESKMKNVFKQFQGHGNSHIVLLSCFLEKDEKEELFNEFTFLQSLKLLEVTDVVEEHHGLVSDLLDVIDSVEEAAKTKSLITKKSTRQFRIVPNTVYKPSTVLYLNFEKEILGTVTVSLGKHNETRIKTTVYNPYSVHFTAEGLSEGKNKVRVFVDDKRVGVDQLILQTPVLASFECPSYLCQTLGLNSADMKTLDKKLVAIFNSSTPENQSHVLLKDTDTDQTRQESPAEIPSLLHFAAKNGLSDLCSILMKIPGSGNVCRGTNCHGKDVYDLAIDSGFQELAEEIKLMQQAEAILEACDSIYLSDTCIKRHQSSHRLMADCVDSPATNIEQEHLYLSLRPDLYSVRKDSRDQGNPPGDNQKKPKLSRQRSSSVPPNPSEGVYANSADYSDKKHKRTNSSEQYTPTSRRMTGPSQTRGERPRSSCFDDPPPLPPPRVTPGPPEVPRRHVDKRVEMRDAYHERESICGSHALDQLLEITKKTTEGIISIEDAERLYETWKKRNQNMSDSIRQKQQTLKDLRDQCENLATQTTEVEARKSALHNVMVMLKKKFSVKTKKELELQISSPIPQKKLTKTGCRERWSNASSQSSCESQFSGGSRDSTMSSLVEGSDSDELVEKNSTDYDLKAKAETEMKTSKRANFLRSISTSDVLDPPPPKIPPRKRIYRV